MHIEEQVSLAQFTTFHIGGMGRFFARVRSIEELQGAVAYAKDTNLKIFVLGGGSNVLISDQGFDGLVIKIEIEGTEILKEKIKDSTYSDTNGEGMVTAGAGESWDSVVDRSVADGLWGLENLSGIPGTVGGAVVQNIGAYGAAVSEVLIWVEVFDTQTNAVKKLSPKECQFDYRDSMFKHQDNLIVTRAAFVLSIAAKPNLGYKDLSERFQQSTPNLKDIRGAVMRIRHDKFPDLLREGTAGSFFKNPIVSVGAASVLTAAYPSMPTFTLPESAGVKIPLAWLLDHELGLKGLSVGGARLYEKQPLVIATSNDASSLDVEELAHTVIEKVQKHFSITIEPEVRIIK